MCNNASPFSLYSTIDVLFHCFIRFKTEKDRSNGTDPIALVSRRFRECLDTNPAKMKATNREAGLS